MEISNELVSLYQQFDLVFSSFFSISLSVSPFKWCIDTTQKWTTNKNKEMFEFIWATKTWNKIVIATSYKKLQVTRSISGPLIVSFRIDSYWKMTARMDETFFRFFQRNWHHDRMAFFFSSSRQHLHQKHKQQANTLSCC